MNKLIQMVLMVGAFALILGCQPTKPQAEAEQIVPDPLWQLDTSSSRLTYISTKNDDIEEHNTLRFLSGSINANKQVNLIIDLNTIDTSIEIRDQRMRELFFETDTYPTAEVTAEIENDLPLMAPYNIDFNFTLHGQSHAFQVPVIIHSGSADMMVTSAEDVILSATNYGLGSALENLREIAGLESINPQVRVSFKLHFKQIY